MLKYLALCGGLALSAAATSAQAATFSTEFWDVEVAQPGSDEFGSYSDPFLLRTRLRLSEPSTRQACARKRRG